jgi:hypothetical protein
MVIPVSFIGCYFRSEGPACRLKEGPKICARGEDNSFPPDCPLRGQEEIVIEKEEAHV